MAILSVTDYTKSRHYLLMFLNRKEKRTRINFFNTCVGLKEYSLLREERERER